MENHDLKEEYRNIIKVSEDDKTLIITCYKLNKLFYCIPAIEQSFLNEEMEAYEALNRVNAVLGLIEEVGQEIKSKI